MELVDLQQLVKKFRDERGWQKFHKPKNLAISLVLETAEFLDHFKWKTDQEMKDYLRLPRNKKAVAEELSDVLHNVLLIAHEFDINLEREFVEKMKKNALKYPLKKK